MPTTTRTSSDPLLANVRGACDDDTRIQVTKLTAVLDWAAANTAAPTEIDHLLAQVEMPLHLAGPGAPVVGEWAAMDLALSLNMTNDAGLNYLAHALELRHRLPRLYHRVVRLEIPVWKAFRVAQLTISLPQAGAAAVDKAIAPFLHSCSWAQVDRAVDAARAQHDPEEAERLRLLAAEGRHATVYLDGAGTAGTVDVVATLDTADAIDLEAALRDGAQVLADLGSTETLNVRRSQALGEMARGQLALELDLDKLDHRAGGGAGLGAGGGRGVTLYAHLDALGTATLDNTHTPVLIDQIRAWCETAGTKVTVKPVIDLTTDLETPAYRPTEAIREHVTLRDQTCVFPDCGRRQVDLDHIVPFDLGGPTATNNLAMLCRRHHRAKTHGHWTYAMTEPALFEWVSPTGATYTVDRRRRRP